MLDCERLVRLVNWYCDNESVMMNLKNVNNSQTGSILLLNHGGLLINNEKYFGTV